jgi:hypothetical protein
VLISSTTAAALGDEWPHSQQTVITLADGSQHKVGVTVSVCAWRD